MGPSTWWLLSLLVPSQLGYFHKLSTFISGLIITALDSENPHHQYPSQRDVVLSWDKDRQEKKRGNKYLCGKKVTEDKHTAKIRLKGEHLKGDPPFRVQKERALGTEDLSSSCCTINFYIHPWSGSALMERVPSTEPKVHFLRLDQNYTREVELLIEGSQFGVTVTESCSFALQAGSRTLRHRRFAAEKGFIFKSFKQGDRRINLRSILPKARGL